MPSKKFNDHKENEKKKSSYGTSVGISRGAADYKGADTDTCSMWVETLEYKDFTPVDATINGATGFYVKDCCGVHLFSALSEYLGQNEIEWVVSDNTWKMSFDAKVTVDDLEGEAGFTT
jgi:hypothetical protein